MRTFKHLTSLRAHLSEPRLWIDMTLLGLVGLLAWLINPQLQLWGISIATMFKVIAMVALLDVISFVVFHWLGSARGVLLKGFLGGFMSSTTVFMQLTQSDKVRTFPPSTLARALLLATLAMTIESVIILYTLTTQTDFLIACLPLILQAVCIGLTLIILPRIPTPQNVIDLTLLASHPIGWLKVLRFAGFILVLIWAIRWLNASFALPLLWSSFVLSIFEAHAVLAASMIELTPTGLLGTRSQVIIAVILGSSLSKSGFVLKTKNLKLMLYVISPLIIASLLMVALYMLIFESNLI